MSCDGDVEREVRQAEYCAAVVAESLGFSFDRTSHVLSSNGRTLAIGLGSVASFFLGYSWNAQFVDEKVQPNIDRLCQTYGLGDSQ